MLQIYTTFSKMPDLISRQLRGFNRYLIYMTKKKACANILLVDETGGVHLEYSRTI